MVTNGNSNNNNSSSTNHIFDKILNISHIEYLFYKSTVKLLLLLLLFVLNQSVIVRIFFQLIYL